jgi:hypothetical protein
MSGMWKTNREIQHEGNIYSVGLIEHVDHNHTFQFGFVTFQVLAERA